MSRTEATARQTLLPVLPEPDPDLAVEHGLFSTRQALRAGFSEAEVLARLRRGRWVRISRGVLRDTNHEVSADDRLLLAMLQAGPQAVVARRSAATVLGLDLLEDPPHHEIAVPDLPRKAPNGLIRADLRKDEVVVVGLLRITTASRTLLDCAATLPLVPAVVLVDSAYRAGWVTPAELDAEWRSRRNLRGRRAARRALDLADPASGSAPETEFRLLVLDNLLPSPTSQYEVFVDGRLVGRVDFAWPEFRLLAEIDGYEYHSGRTPFQKDRTRWNDLTADWTVLVFTPEDIRQRPHEVVERLRRHLRH